MVCRFSDCVAVVGRGGEEGGGGEEKGGLNFTFFKLFRVCFLEGHMQ